jgi:hypothetical protein
MSSCSLVGFGGAVKDLSFFLEISLYAPPIVGLKNITLELHRNFEFLDYEKILSSIR